MCYTLHTVWLLKMRVLSEIQKKKKKKKKHLSLHNLEYVRTCFDAYISDIITNFARCRWPNVQK